MKTFKIEVEIPFETWQGTDLTNKKNLLDAQEFYDESPTGQWDDVASALIKAVLDGIRK